MTLFNRTALFTAVEMKNIKIIELLLMNPNIDVNIINVLLFLFFYYSKSLIFL